MSQLALTDRSWSALLERACTQRLVTPVFQPIVDTVRAVVCGYEGLSRFQGSDAASPQDWFTAAAMHGYAGQLEATALSALFDHRGDLPPNCFLSVNLSPGALLASEVQAVLTAEGDLTGLVFEITEQTPVEDYTELSSILDEVRARGGLIAVDDTGAGYASLRHLLALRPNFVKLDRSLVTGVDLDPARASAVAAIGAFAGELDAWVVAEGIEVESELERLLDLGVPLVQGYLLGRPYPRMLGLAGPMATRLRARQGMRRQRPLAALGRPALTTRVVPDLVVRPAILVDAFSRPREVLMPSPESRQGHRYPAMCVQPDDDVADVALRAAARPDRGRYAPLCLCDDLGRAQGLIPVESLLESLARQARRGVRPAG